MPAARSHATAADLVVLAAALHLDEQRPAGEVRLRDARLGAELAARSDDRTALTLAWLERMSRADATIRGWYERATTSLQACGLVAGLAGLVLGWVAALGAFYYEGSGRVNVIAVIVVLVGVPALFLVLFLVAALPRRWIAWMPGATAVSVLARAISPGRLARLALRFAPADLRESIAGLRARTEQHQTLHARVQKWLVLRWSQVFAVAFQCGALSAALGLILFTDLVFGWSTTLASGDAGRDAARVHRVTTILAAPWGWAIGDAVPSPDLIRESRYYRSVKESVSPERASRLGAWWPFLVLSITVYGLGPRLVLLALAGRRLSHAVAETMAVTPGVSTLVRRLEAARVQTHAPGAGDAPVRETSAAAPAAGPGDTAAAPELRVCAIINWADVPVSRRALAEALGDAPQLLAGGAATLADDQRVIEQVAARAQGPDDVVAIVVKAWEPPLLEFVDFLQAVRRAVGRGAGIAVYPLAPDGSGAVCPGSPSQADVWRRRLGKLGDPWLRVVERRGEAAP